MNNNEFSAWVSSLKGKSKNRAASDLLGLSVPTIERYKRGVGRGSKIPRSCSILVEFYKKQHMEDEQC